MKTLFLPILLLFSHLACAHKEVITPSETCLSNSEIQKQKSAELITIAEQDQADRELPPDKMDWNKILPRDLERRIRVATLFAEGCLKTAPDFASAATVYQHGNVPGHYYQAFIWANEALKLGDESQRWWVAAAIDRYLVAIGHKQLFGTQMSKPNGGEWCIQPVEPDFPERLRLKYVKKSVLEQIAQILSRVEPGKSPDSVLECTPNLRPTPKGTIPGFY